MATPVFLPGESHGQMSLVGYSSWGQSQTQLSDKQQQQQLCVCVCMCIYIISKIEGEGSLWQLPVSGRPAGPPDMVRLHTQGTSHSSGTRFRIHHYVILDKPLHLFEAQFSCPPDGKTSSEECGKKSTRCGILLPFTTCLSPPFMLIVHSSFSLLLICFIHF